MLTCERNPSSVLLAEIKDKKERLMSLVEYIKVKYGGLDQEKLGSDLHEDDQHSLSSHEPLVHDISDLKEDLTAAPHEEDIGDEGAQTTNTS